MSDNRVIVNDHLRCALKFQCLAQLGEHLTLMKIGCTLQINIDIVTEHISKLRDVNLKAVE